MPSELLLHFFLPCLFQGWCCWALCLLFLNCNSFSSLGDELQTLFSSRCNLYWDWTTSAEWAKHVLWHHATMQDLQKEALGLVLVPAPEFAVIGWAHSPQYRQLAPGQPQPRVCLSTVWRQLILAHFLEEGNPHLLGWAHEISSHFSFLVGCFIVVLFAELSPEPDCNGSHIPKCTGPIRKVSALSICHSGDGLKLSLCPQCPGPRVCEMVH